MKPPTLEVADIIRSAGDSFIGRNQSHLSWIRVVLVYAPDRLSRKYAYQILLAEEFSRCGVELIFLKSPAGATPEDQVLVQFQGMIAEYERAQCHYTSQTQFCRRVQQDV
jgi:hypothetical protein